jgi:outer membrane lipoprotein
MAKLETQLTPRNHVMSKSATHIVMHIAAAALLASLLGCAPAPIYKTSPDTVKATPGQVARTPERFQNAPVIWGGTVVKVSNFSDHSEIEMLAYPLDSSQRPRLGKDKGIGRFIAMMPGYVEPLDYPPGSPMTFSGHINGVRSSTVGKAPYVFPLVSVIRHHAWTAEEMRSGHPHVSFGLGVGFGSGGYRGGGVGIGVH